MATNLPEGTDSIIEDIAPDEPVDGMGDDGDAGTGGEVPDGDDVKAPASDAKAKIGGAAAGLKDQAADKAREYALMGKDKATETLHGVSKMIDDAAATVDEKVGAQYGDYARQAAETVKGFATSLEGKDVDELFGQARDMVVKSPAIAIGAAAAIGFVLSRVLKAGFEPATTEEKDVTFKPDPSKGTKV